MGRGNGLTEAVMALLSVDCPMSVAEVAAAVAEEHKTSAGAILTQKFNGGHLLRTGQPRRYRYSLKPDSQTAEPDEAEKRGGMPDKPPSMSASLGTVCGVTAPANKSEGTIEQALQVILDGDEGMTLDEILAALPVGWSRAQAMSALADGVMDQWVKVINHRGMKTHYVLCVVPPACTPDPLAIPADAPSQPAVDSSPMPFDPPAPNLRERMTFTRSHVRGLLIDACRDSDVPALLSDLAGAAIALESALRRLR